MPASQLQQRGYVLMTHVIFLCPLQAQRSYNPLQELISKAGRLHRLDGSLPPMLEVLLERPKLCVLDASLSKGALCPCFLAGDLQGLRHLLRAGGECLRCTTKTAASRQQQVGCACQAFARTHHDLNSNALTYTMCYSQSVAIKPFPVVGCGRRVIL
jgi:hypothetical protein